MSKLVYVATQFLLIYFLLNLAVFILNYIYSCTNNKRVWEALRGKYCLIINANTEEGEALCFEVIERGLKLVMVGDSEEKLHSIKSKIKNKVKVSYHVLDFSNCLDFSFLEKYDIGLVINNLKFKDYKPQFFTDQRIERLIDTYFRGQFQMLNQIICSMMERNKGFIVNIGYTYNIHPNPHRSFLSGIIAAYKSWSESMYYELMPYNINVEYMDVGNLCTSDILAKRPSLFCPSIETFATFFYNTFGSSNFTIPYFPHLLQYVLLMMIPGSFVARYRSSGNIKFNRYQ